MLRTIRPVANQRGMLLAAACITLLLALAAVFLPRLHLMAKGDLAGGLLVLAGLAELMAAASRRQDRFAVAALGSGGLTAAAGLLFLAIPLASFLPALKLLMLWLGLRGLWLLGAAWEARSERHAPWLAARGATDALLSLLIAAGLPVTVLVYLLFGPTPELVAKFSVALATSFLVAGVALVALASREETGRAQARGPSRLGR